MPLLRQADAPRLLLRDFNKVRGTMEGLRQGFALQSFSSAWPCRSMRFIPVFRGVYSKPKKRYSAVSEQGWPCIRAASHGGGPDRP